MVVEEAVVEGGGGPSAEPAGAPGRASGWTTSRWLSVGVGAALTVLVVLGVLGGWLLAHGTAVNQRLINRSTPALIGAVRLDNALINQETGVRGYGMTGRSEFLEPYHLGVAAQDRTVADLRRLLTAEGVGAAALDAVLARAADWHRVYADRVVAAPPGQPVEVATTQAATGKAAFDALRAASNALQGELTASRAQAGADLVHVRTVRNWTFSAIAAVILAGAVLAFVGLRRAVSGPLSRLAADATRVSAGSFDHPIQPSGPADIQTVAGAVERMRRRLAAELQTSEQARHVLDRQAEELRRSNTDLEQFAYVASHDLQEPLRKVISFCQLLERRYTGQLDDRADKYIAFIVDGAARMQKLIQDLLAFSRAGRAGTAIEPVDLEQVYHRAVDSLTLTIDETDAQLSHDPLPTVPGHGASLEMLLTNLLGNALKFRHPERTPVIHVGADRDGDTWRLSVTDNGIGIDPQFSEKVFVIFQRLHSRDAYPGTGIGLALCRKIVEFHGGHIDLDNGYTDGTRMILTLPVAGSITPAALIPASRQDDS
ncbi:sensor histidine kinase [Frankia nepalensis]|uniref:sensor histidine kinase n=1 Tax=Frankia nepalensis TaxID=1836974 RepID=UPI0027DBF69F|nr:ATP-binding protein [Frankia nepalensis]